MPLRVDFIDTIRHKDEITDKQVESIDQERALLAPARITGIVTYILEHFDQKTKRSSGYYRFNKLVNITDVAKNSNIKEQKEKQQLNGFNSMFAVSSIRAAQLYYTEFKKQMAERLGSDPRIAIIYSSGVNGDDTSDIGFLDEENSDNTEGLDVDSRTFLDNAIADYNLLFDTAYDTSAEKFQNYYKDVSLRMKNKEIDLLIVVNMFLTGFDATTLNTLWVDKNLKYHGLIQAFSRTNRILNSVKTFGNIICFRNLQKEAEDAISLFGDKEACGIVLLKTYNDYYYGYDDGTGKHQKGYKEYIDELRQKYPLDSKSIGEDKEKDFIALFGDILRFRNLLSTFDEFSGNEILPPIDFQDYTSHYNDLYDKYRRTTAQKESINDDIVFEIELVKQIEVSVDYILMLIETHHQSNSNNAEFNITLDKAINSSLKLRSKKELIDDFIRTLSSESNISRDWARFVKEEQKKDLDKLIAEENLNAQETRRFIRNAFREGQLKTTGPDIGKIMPPISRFGNSARSQKKQTIIDRLNSFFDKYADLETSDFENR